MNGALAILLLLAAPRPLLAASPTRMLERMERIAADMKGAHPLDRRAASKKLDAFRGRFLSEGLSAVRALSYYIEAKERPLTVRVHAASFLGSTGAPEAFGALKRVALDDGETPGLRSTAVLSLGGLRVPPRTLRPVFEALIAEGTTPLVRREALGRLGAIGTRRPDAVLEAAKSFGTAPEGLDRIAAENAAKALAASPLPEAERALFDLLRFQKRGSPLTTEILTQLSRRGPSGPLPRRDLETLTEILFADALAPALQCARFLGRTKDPAAVAPLARALRVDERPAVLAEAADALAAIGDPDAAEALRAARAGLPEDPRFARRSDAVEYAARIEAAAATFGPKRPAAGAPTPGPVTTPPFRYEGWPGEGRPVIVWTGGGNELPLRREPARDARAAKALPVKEGEEIPFVASLVVMRSPGLARASSETTLTGAEFGETASLSEEELRRPHPTGTLTLAVGDLLEVAAYRAEGFCFVRRRSGGPVFETECPRNRKAFEVLETPRTDWWLKASGPGGVEGWFLSDAPGLEFRSRRF